MYGTDRGSSGLQRDDENEALAEGLTFFQPVPIRETVDRDAVDARDLVEGVPLVHLVARGPLPDVPRGAGGDGGSIAILTDGDTAKKRHMQKELARKGFQTIPIYLSRRGLRVWKSLGDTGL